MFKVIFYISILVLFYTYFGYPLLLFILGKFNQERRIKKKAITPKISLIVPAYNEEAGIREKLQNMLSLNYPKEKMEIAVISDASTDKTDEIVREFARRGLKLYRLRKRSGKIAAYRSVFPLLQGEIIVFSDATSVLEKDSLKHLISNFNDSSVGCVGGLLLYVNPKHADVGEGESKYWDYERKVKQYESKLCSLTSISGTFYAVRKNLYPYNIKEDLADDLMVPFAVRKRGYRTILEEKAICREVASPSIKAEIAKRKRITIQNIRGLIEQAEILNPFKYGLYSLLVASHKLLRLLAPAFLLFVFIANAALTQSSWIYAFLFIAQIMFYIVGFVGYFLNKKAEPKIINAVFYFCLSNWAILMGIIRFLRGEKVATWEPVRANV